MSMIDWIVVALPIINSYCHRGFVLLQNNQLFQHQLMTQFSLLPCCSTESLLWKIAPLHVMTDS
jgi:hypothetical protein